MCIRDSWSTLAVNASGMAVSFATAFRFMCFPSPQAAMHTTARIAYSHAFENMAAKNVKARYGGGDGRQQAAAEPTQEGAGSTGTARRRTKCTSSAMTPRGMGTEVSNCIQ